MEPERNVNIVDNIWCYNLGEYRAGYYEFSLDEYPPCLVGSENVTLSMLVEEMPTLEMEDYAGVEEGL